MVIRLAVIEPRLKTSARPANACQRVRCILRRQDHLPADGLPQRLAVGQDGAEPQGGVGGNLPALVSLCSPGVSMLRVAMGLALGRPLGELLGERPVPLGTTCVAYRRHVQAPMWAERVESVEGLEALRRLGGVVRSARAAHGSRPVVCVLTRSGRARLLACAGCGEVARCAACGAAVGEAAEAGAGLSCRACGSSRARLCIACGGIRLKALRVGTARAAEELAALTGLEVAEVSGPRLKADGLPAAPVLVGTEAVLHRARTASLVVFLDLDQELLAPRLNASVQALALLALASRLTGGRRRARPAPGSVVVQTRLPDHEVVQAALHADPGVLLAAELERRRSLGLPPARAVAFVTGEALEEVRSALAAAAPDLETALVGDRLLVRALDAPGLADGLAVLGPLARRARIEVDPLRL